MWCLIRAEQLHWSDCPGQQETVWEQQDIQSHVAWRKTFIVSPGSPGNSGRLDRFELVLNIFILIYMYFWLHMCLGQLPLEGRMPKWPGQFYLGQQITLRCKPLLLMCWGPIYLHGLILIPSWITNLMPSKVCDEITYPSLYFSCEWISDWILHFIMDIITYSYWE